MVNQCSRKEERSSKNNLKNQLKSLNLPNSNQEAREERLSASTTTVFLYEKIWSKNPQNAHPTLDGIDLRDFSQDELRRLITILFQQPVQYHTTAAENIALGDLSAQPTPADIERAAQAAGAEAPIKRLPQEYDTVLGKWFGGAELSVGEWQRVALARAFLRQAPIIILDEPTSAMDSWAEADWLARFRTLTAGRTAIIITHRFTTAMQADVIYVMDSGKIVESGTHQELLALGRRYAQSWRAQMNGKFRGTQDE